MKQRIIVLGAYGQLGKCFQSVAGNPEYQDLHFVFMDIDSLDITDEVAVQHIAQDWQCNKDSYSSTLAINCAAYTQVDRAEEDKERCMQVNLSAPEILCRQFNPLGIGLIQISSDYVFDGKASEPYTEEDATLPLSVYGLSKDLCEKKLLETMTPGQTLLVRTQWLYSMFANNFVTKMIELARDREELRVVSDQYGAPTYAPSLVDALIAIARCYDGEHRFRTPLLHYSSRGGCSWFDLANRSVGLYYDKGATCRVSPIPTSEFPTLAVRPSYSVLSKLRLREVYHFEPLRWEYDLKACIRSVKEL